MIRSRGKKSFTRKIWLTILISALLMILSAWIILSVFYQDVLIDNAVVQLSTEDSIHCETIQNFNETANSCVNTIILHLNAALERQDLVQGYPQIRTATQKKIYYGLLNTFSMFNDPVEVLLVWNNGIYFYQGKYYTMNYGGTELLEELQRLDVTRKGKWLTRLDAHSLIHGDGLYFVKPYTEIDSGKQKGYVILRLKSLESFDSVAEASRRYYLFGDDGLLLQTTDAAVSDRIGSLTNYEQRLAQSQKLYSELEQSQNADNMLYRAQKLRCGWKFIAVGDLNHIIIPLRNTERAIFAVCAAVLLAMSGVIWLVIKLTIRPIQMLSDHMLQHADGLPEVLSVKHGNDEIGMLIDRYNQMITCNQELFAQVVEGEQLQKKLEFSLLQAQVKPHFLYNSLDVIYCLNAIGRYDEAGTMTKLLSEYYRRSLSTGMECIQLSDEIEMTRIYLEIQMVRYRSVLSFSIEYEQPLPEMSIPKLTLQPLVENAIYHGIKPMGRAGHVRICIACRGEWVEIRVSDDGVGFTQTQFDRSQTDSARESFGLHSVAQRLRLYYGENVRFELEEVERGACILVAIRGNGKEVAKHV